MHPDRMTLQDVQHGIGVEEWEGGSRYDGQWPGVAARVPCGYISLFLRVVAI